MKIIIGLTLLLRGLALGPIVPVLPLATAPPGNWTPPGPIGASYGDVRAVVQTDATVCPGNVTIQVFWRRRDPTPWYKSVFAVDGLTNQRLPVLSAAVEDTCGVIEVACSQPGLLWIYYLPYNQGGSDAAMQFSWQGCNSTDPSENNPCVLGGVGASMCDSAGAGAAAVVRIENRDNFNAFTEMEMMASPAESSATIAALQSHGSPFVGVFPEDRDHSVRVFDAGIPVRWTSPAANPSFVGQAHPGEYYVFQLGLWAYAGDVANLSATWAGALPMQFVNLQGIDVLGNNYSRTMSLLAGNVGSLWIGMPVPASTTPGSYSGVVSLSSPGHAAVDVSVTLTVDDQPVPYGGAENITSMSRLQWLYSTRGLEDVVPSPFVPLTVTGGAGAPLIVQMLNKQLQISPLGLPSALLTNYTTQRRGASVTMQYDVIGAPFELPLIVNGSALPVTVVAPAAITTLSNSSVQWSATWLATAPAGNVTVLVTGTADFTSFCEFSATLTPPAGVDISLDDVQLTTAWDPSIRQYAVGYGSSGTRYTDMTWNWSNTTATNKVWVGRAEAGMMISLIGDGLAWSSPMFGADYPVIPFVPDTWGGADALPQGNPYGASVRNGSFMATSGPRILSASVPTPVFRWDVAFTPSKAVNWTRHWNTRAFQVGYGTEYMTPQQVAALGCTVVTLHQGTPGIINGSLVNPYISYPFLPDTVPLLYNYTQQSNALGMATKAYYTVRELSSHAVETFAFLAQAGEIFLDENPWTVVQPGYSHAWNAHGGSAYLHQHLVTHYAACWQQLLSNGEFDPSVCDAGVSRLFNYYVEGLWWLFTQEPYLNGNYYDGTNFPRIAMQRIRRTADAAAAASGSGFHALLDLHTGEDPSPPAVSYASHYPLMDYVWNGEGFDFSGSPAYWLVELSSRIHGMSGDMLGSGPGSVFRGMLFGMTERNAGTSPAIWQFWDAVAIHETVSIGWWEDDVPVTASSTCSSGHAHTLAGVAAPTCATWNVTTNGYYAAGQPCSSANGNEYCFANESIASAQAACCADPVCAGFSAVPNGQGSYYGCFKKSVTCFVSDAGASGYYKPGFVPPPDPDARVWVTTFTAYGQRAVVVLASFCDSPVSTTLSIDFGALGLSSDAVNVTAPAIPGVQSAALFANATGPYQLSGSGGLILLIQAV